MMSSKTMPRNSDSANTSEVMSSIGHHKPEEIQWECPDQAGSNSIIF